MDSKLIRASRRIPAHVQIVNIVRERIEKGYYTPDEWLPTERDLAAELKVSRPVVQVAFKHLREEGLVVQQGPGHRSRISPRGVAPAGYAQNESTSRTIVAIMTQAPWMAYGFSIVRGINASARRRTIPSTRVSPGATGHPHLLLPSCSKRGSAVRIAGHRFQMSGLDF